MKVPLHVVQARRERLAQMIEQVRYLPVKELCRRLGVSEATARRDLAALVQEKKITRTYGGALSEFNERFPSFRERQRRASRGKAKIAHAALGFIQPGQTCFFDSGTTISAVAEVFRERPITPLTVVTSNLPVGEMLASIEDLQVYQVAGQLLHRQSTLLGEAARKSLEFWNFDVSFLSAEAMDARGLWNSQAAIVEQQMVVRRRSQRVVFCIDATKINRQAPHFLLTWTDLDFLITDAAPERLSQAGIEIPSGRCVFVNGPSTTARTSMPHVTKPLSEGGDDLPVHIL